MNQDFNRVLASPAKDRLDLFLAAASRLGTTMQNVEKDFWVCWALDALFNGLPADGPRLMFKGGTSLSKAHGLIERFSEDIDITIFRTDIDVETSIEDLEALSRKQRDRRLDEIRDACRDFIGNILKTQLEELAELLPSIGGKPSVILASDDPDNQSLLIQYPALADRDAYVRPAVKLEAGAKSALDPHSPRTIKPYVADTLSDLNLAVPGIMTVDPVRTFWDKILIVHSLRHSFDDRGKLRGGGQRVSRHYYDLHRILHTDIGRRAIADLTMATDCARHERMFFRRPSSDTAVRGTFTLIPPTEMLDLLRRDYRAMEVMIFGTVPSFDDVLSSIARLEEAVNK